MATTGALLPCAAIRTPPNISGLSRAQPTKCRDASLEPHGLRSLAWRQKPLRARISAWRCRQASHFAAFVLRTPEKARRRCREARAGGLEDVALSQHEDEAAVKEIAREVADGLRGTTIFLVGMMGSGKSTIGKVLAEALGYYFFDSDAVVEAAAGGATTAQIFAENGEQAFRDIESQVIAELSATVRLVVATGGGAVTRTANWGKMRDGISVWIDVPADVLARRVVAAGTESRPLLHQGAGEGEGSLSGDPMLEVAAKLTKILEERRAMYANADATVSLQEVASMSGLEDEELLTSSHIAYEVLGKIRELLRDRQRQDNERREQPGNGMGL